MKLFQRLTVVATIATYVLIFTGGLVRVSGAGLGCPDWPTCFGRWLPPTSVDQLPANIDASMFNFTLAWIEYGNRLLGMVTGLLILAAAIAGLVQARHRTRLWLPPVLAALATAYVGWQGSRVIASELEPFLVAIHALGAMVIALLLVYTLLQIHFEQHPGAEKTSRYPVRRSGLVLVVLILLGVQNILGTQVRAAVKLIREAAPLGGQSMWVDMIGPIRWLHEGLGILITLYAIEFGIRLLRKSEAASPLVRQSAIGMIVVAALQLLGGGMMISMSYLSLLQLIHLWGAAILAGLLLVLYIAIRRSERVTL